MMNLLTTILQLWTQLTGGTTMGDDEEFDGKTIAVACRACERSRVVLIDARIYARDDHDPDFIDDAGVGYVQTANRPVVCPSCGHRETRHIRDLQREAAPWTKTDARRDVRASIRLSNERDLSDFRGH